MTTPAFANITSVLAGSELTVTSVDEANVAIACANAVVTVNGIVPLDLGPVACNTITAMVVDGNAQPNLITLVDVTSASFPVLAGTQINAGAGDDIVTGSDAADVIDGGPNNDTIDGDDNPLGAPDRMLGGDGDDVLVWNPGKDDDINVGGTGNDTSVIVGGGVAEEFFIRKTVAGSGVVRFERTTAGGNPAAFFVDITETELLRLNANAGNDTVNANTLPAALIALELNGGDGDDTLIGGDGADVLNGGNNNDRLDGDDNPLGAPDRMLGGDGDDVLVWIPGKDDDINIGGAGNDVSEIVGGGVAEEFFIRETAAGSGVVHFERTLAGGNPAAFFVDITETELLRLNANAGNDTVNASTLPAALIALELNGGDGDDILIGGDGADALNGGNNNDRLDGDDNPLGAPDRMLGGDGDDVLVWNPGKDDDINIGGAGYDISEIVGGGVAEEFFIRETVAGSGVVHFERTLAGGNPAAFFVDITETELLRLNANAGNDTVNASTLPAALIALELNGGAGNDTLRGSAGADLLNGNEDNDTLIGGLNPAANPDLVLGGAGDDLMIWNLGDGSDVNEGEAGSDTVLVNAAGADEVFTVVQSGNRVEIERFAPTAFQVDGGSFEILQLNLAGGNDVVNTQVLSGVAQVLDGGANTQQGDLLSVKGFSGDASVSPILQPGFGRIDHTNFEKSTNERTGGSFSALLEGAQQVPPVNTPALGRGTVTLDALETEITVSLQFEGLSSGSTLAHIHGPAPVGQNAAPLFDLVVRGGTAETVPTATFAVTPQQVSDLKAGLWYFNVHSQNHLNGEIRGQILTDVVLEANLRGTQVVPSNNSPATGFAKATLAGSLDRVTISLAYTGLTGEGAPGVNSAVRIHGPASRGQNAPSIDTIVLPASGTASGAFLLGPFDLTLEQANDLRSGHWYIEVSSTEFPDGEIRGQFTQSIHVDGFE